MGRAGTKLRASWYFPDFIIISKFGGLNKGIDYFS
jgi:hypothetical protein